MTSAVRPELLDLARRLRRVAKIIGTQAAAARVARVSLRQMQKYVSARSRPSFWALNRLSVASGVSINWLAGEDVSAPRLPSGERAMRLRELLDQWPDVRTAHDEYGFFVALYETICGHKPPELDR